MLLPAVTTTSRYADARRHPFVHQAENEDANWRTASSQNARDHQKHRQTNGESDGKSFCNACETRGTSGSFKARPTDSILSFQVGVLLVLVVLSLQQPLLAESACFVVLLDSFFAHFTLNTLPRSVLSEFELGPSSNSNSLCVFLVYLGEHLNLDKRTLKYGRSEHLFCWEKHLSWPGEHLFRWERKHLSWPGRHLFCWGSEHPANRFKCSLVQI